MRGVEKNWDGSFKPFQGLFYISTIQSWNLDLSDAIVSNPSRGYSTFLLYPASILEGASEDVSNPSRGYSTFLLNKIGSQCPLHINVSNPSRGYSTFLRRPQNTRNSWVFAFQTLPGVILHFYAVRRACWGRSLLFQTLPGVILHFYRFVRCSSTSTPRRFKPFQGLFYISTYFNLSLSHPPRESFKPFQGLFYISTLVFFAFPWIARMFQTLPGVILHFYKIVEIQEGWKVVVSNPSRGYSTFLPFLPRSA